MEMASDNSSKTGGVVFPCIRLDEYPKEAHMVFELGKLTMKS